jgi:gliding motility-associated lipoprotein GldH
MKLQNTFLLLLLSLLISCNSKTIFSEIKEGFTANQWPKKEVQSFSFSIEEENKNYDLSITISHVYDYQFDSVPMEVGITNPKGETEILFFDLIIKDAKGKDKGDCLGDLCDLKQTFKKNIKLSKGNYTVHIAHRFNHDYLPNITSLGLEVDKAE